MAHYEFETFTGKVIIDYEKCRGCNTRICVEACPWKVLKLNEEELPTLSMEVSDVKRGRCNECLACEQECYLKGYRGLKVILPLLGYE